MLAPNQARIHWAAILLACLPLGFSLRRASAQPPLSLSQLAARCSIEVVEADKAVSVALPSGLIEGSAASPSGLNWYLPLLAEELGVYPPEAVARTNLKRIVLCEDLLFSGKRCSGLPDFEHGSCYLDVVPRQGMETHAREALHHELCHIIYVRRCGAIGDYGWAALNIPGFRYGSGGWWQHDRAAEPAGHVVPGFVNRYSMSAVEEDQAEIYAHLLVEPALMALLTASDEILRKKVFRMKASLESFCPSMDAAFWERAQKLDRKPRRLPAVPGRTPGVAPSGEDAECLAAWTDGFALQFKGDYPAAARLNERAVELALRVFGPEHVNTATVLSNLAESYSGMGQYAAAEPLYRRAVAIREKALGLNHPEVAASLNSLASLCYSRGQYAAAGRLFKRALAIREKALGPDHPDVAASLESLGTLYRAERLYAQAEPLLDRSLAILEKSLGDDHPNVASSLDSLAAVYLAQGRYTRAEWAWKRSLAITEKALGPGHPDVAGSLNNLALLYCAECDYAHAEPLFKRALAIREIAFGPESLNVAVCLENIATLFRKTGREEAASDLERRAAAIRAIKRRGLKEGGKTGQGSSTPGTAYITHWNSGPPNRGTQYQFLELNSGDSIHNSLEFRTTKSGDTIPIFGAQLRGQHT